jgi:hypothetical protein
MNRSTVLEIDPTTARAGLRTAREVISGRQISYPVPYVLVILSLLCVACLVIAIFALDAVRIVALILGCGAFVLAALLLVLAMTVKPELLRSERHEQVMRLIDLAGDPELGPNERARMVTTVLGEITGPNETRGRRGTRLGENHD